MCNPLLRKNSVIAIIGVHDGETHANLSVRTLPDMFGINFSFLKEKVAQLWKAKSIVTGTCTESKNRGTRNRCN